MEEIQWKSLSFVACGDNYKISQFGTVVNVKTNRVLQFDMKEGYLRVKLAMDGIKKNYLVHRLVAQAFIPNPEDKPQVNHLDCNRANSYYGNLEWVTSQENTEYIQNSEFGAWNKHNKPPKQPKPKPKREPKPKVKRTDKVHNAAKLTEADVLKIRELHDAGGYTHKQLGEMFGVGRRTITAIVNRQNWTHI